MQGASPLASPGAEPGRRGLNLRWRCPAEGLPSGAPEQGAKPASSGGTAVLLAGFSCRIKVFLSYPPSPLPLRGRGSPRLFHARGFAPCIPGAESGRRGLNLRWRCPAGGLPSGAPEQEGETRVQGAEPGRRGLNLRWRCPAGGLPEWTPAGADVPISGVIPDFPIPAEAAKPILQHPKSQPPCMLQDKSGTGHERRFQSEIYRESSWGFGGFFQEAPNVSPFPRFFVSLLYLFSLPMR